VAIIAVFCISVAQLLVGTPIFEAYRFHAAAALAGAGIVAWFIGRKIGARQKAATEDEGPRFVLFDLRYWGPMLLLLGVITLFIRQLHTRVETQVAQAPAAPKKIIVPPAPTPAPAPEPVVAKVPVIFPDLKIQGVFFRAQSPFAIINGDSYAVGDRIGEVEVKAIERESVMLELHGQFKMLTLN
jgi:hypothetical protein